MSSTPSDFSRDRLFYFTPGIHVAEYYASQVKRRAHCVSVVVVCPAIPKSAIEQLASPAIQQLYYPDPMWKELIWTNRTLRPLPPTQVSDLIPLKVF